MAIQDHNLNLPEQQYRDLDIPSYSMLSAIEQQGVDVIKGVKTGFDLKFGSLVDTMCFEPHKVDKIFHRGTQVKAPITSHKKVVDFVLESINVTNNNKQTTQGLKKRRNVKISENLNDYGSQIVNGCIHNGILKSYDDTKKIATIIASSSNYFKDRVKSLGKILVKDEMWKLAQITANTLNTHPFTAKYFTKNVKGIEIIYQYQFCVELNGRKVKGMLDCLIVNHVDKVIIPVDLKTGESPVKLFPKLYTGHRYYIQGALYREAIKEIVKNDWDLTGYKVNNFEFVYISKTNPNKPMVFIVDDNLHDHAMNGFTDIHGYEYKGVNSLITEYYECVEDGYCDYTRDETLSKGRVIMSNIVR